MKIKIIKSPYFSVYQGFEYLPSLSLAGLYSFLKGKGFDIVQEDLSVLHHENKKKQLAKIRNSCSRLFLNKKRLLNYLAGGYDKEFDDIIIQYITKNTFEGIDILLISVHRQDFYSSILGLLLARSFKLKDKHKIVILGGEALQWMHIYDEFELYNDIGILDYYITGPGEQPLFQLLNKIQGASIRFRDIPGLCYRQDGKIYKSPREADQILTVPDFNGFHLSSYAWHNSTTLNKISKKAFPSIDILMLPVRMICGCPNRCAFCSSCSFKKLYYIQPEQAAENLAKLSKKYNTPYFFFMDDEVNVSEWFINEFCDKIIEMGLKIYWTACASIKQMNNPETLVKMRKAGACRLIFGLETASPRLIDFINKNVELEHVSNVLKWSHEAGIWTGIELIAGLPYENEKDVFLTADFIRTHRELFDLVYLNIFFLSVGSNMFDSPQKFGLKNVRSYYRLSKLLENDLENYRYAFDEIGGLSWNDKQCQMGVSYKTIAKLIWDCGIWSPQIRDEMSLLFYLYSVFSDKREIRKYFELYKNYSLFSGKGA